MAHPSRVHRVLELVGREVGDWAPCSGREALVLLLARLFSSNKKKVGMTHSSKKQKQSCNLLKGSCLDAPSEVCKRRKVSCRSRPIGAHPLSPLQAKQRAFPGEFIFWAGKIQPPPASACCFSHGEHAGGEKSSPSHPSPCAWVS